MNIIVAASKNMGIGFKNQLPWNLKKELQYFKRKTVGNGNNLVVMGKNTWLSLPKKPLPLRFNCVLSTTLKTKLQDTKFVANKKELEKFLYSNHFSNIWIIGGESIYKEFINESYVKNIYLTHIHEDFECDTFFPEIPDDFYLKNTSDMKIENNILYNYKIFSRKDFDLKPTVKEMREFSFLL
tara:strand:+ start:312 stop:860 length:549 start_codon:yes stop_codon:yes gene_type:complete